MVAPLVVAALSVVGTAAISFVGRVVGGIAAKGAEAKIMFDVLLGDPNTILTKPFSIELDKLFKTTTDWVTKEPIASDFVNSIPRTSIATKMSGLFNLQAAALSNVLAGTLSIDKEKDFQNIRKELKPFLVPADIATRSRIVNPDQIKLIQEVYLKSGFDKAQQDLWFDAARPLPSIIEIKDFIFRNIQRVKKEDTVFQPFEPIKSNILDTIEPDLVPLIRPIFNSITKDFDNMQKTFEDEMERLGFVIRDKSLLQGAFNTIPGLQDIITQMIRDIFDPKIVKNFRLTEDFPKQFAIEAAKRGLRPEDAIRIWQAHWILPSPQQFFEMNHRELIDLKELDFGLKAADFNPFFRKKLIGIARRLPTRVDIRRLRREGVIGDAKVQKLYEQIGFTFDSAKDLAIFARKDAFRAFRNDVVNETENQFLDGQIKIPEVKRRFESLGLGDGEQNFRIMAIQIRKSRNFVNDIIKVINSLFVDGKIDGTEWRNLMKTSNVPESLIAEQQDLTEFARLQKQKTVTFADLKRYLKSGTIDGIMFDKLATTLNVRPEKINLERQDIQLRERVKDERDLTKSEILKAFRVQAIDRKTTETLLTGLGFDKVEQNIILNTELVKIRAKEQDDFIDVIKRQAIIGTIPQDQAFSALSKLDLNPNRVNLIIKEILRERDKQIERFNRRDLEDMFKLDLIDENAFTLRMGLLKWDIGDVSLIIQKLKLEKGVTNNG